MKSCEGRVYGDKLCAHNGARFFGVLSVDVYRGARRNVYRRIS